MINRLFSKLLKTVETLTLGEVNNLIQSQKNGKFYRLTLDSSGEIHELQRKLGKEDNLNDNLLIYETDVLITDQLNADNFIYNGINCTVIGEKELSELGDVTSNSIEERKINFNEPKIMRLISREVAEREITNA